MLLTLDQAGDGGESRRIAVRRGGLQLTEQPLAPSIMGRSPPAAVRLDEAQIGAMAR
jgi:hypothetical protein